MQVSKFEKGTEVQGNEVASYPSIKSVQEGVTCSVSHTAASVGLTSFAKLQTLTTKSTLVNLAVVRAAEGHSEVLQLQGQEEDKSVCETLCVGACWSISWSI